MTSPSTPRNAIDPDVRPVPPALARRAGPTRLSGLLLLAGLLCIVVAVILRPPQIISPSGLGVLVQIGAAVMMLGGIGIGALGLVGRRSPLAAAA